MSQFVDLKPEEFQTGVAVPRGDKEEGQRRGRAASPIKYQGKSALVIICLLVFTSVFT